MKLRYNTFGEITSGRNVGWYIKLIDDRINSGGFYVYEFKDLNGNEGFDTWLENEKDIDGFISESDWKIKWLDIN